MTFASIRAAAQHIAKVGTITPHQLAALSQLDEMLRAHPDILQEFTYLWRAVGSSASEQPEISEPDRGLAITKRFESCRLTSYPDPGTGGTPWTIGWGSTRMDGKPVQPGQTITQAKADKMLQDTWASVRATLAKTIPGWASFKKHQQEALTSFAYNCGEFFYGAEGYYTITKALREGRLNDVPAAMKLYVNPGTPVEAGLRNRRAAETDLWKGVSLPPPSPITLPTQQPIPNKLVLTRTGKRDSRGLDILALHRMTNSIPMGKLLVVSGARGAQVFRKGPDSVSGSLQPIPQGRWRVEDIVWAGGKDNYNASWGPSLGPASVPLTYLGPGTTPRRNIEAHYDANAGTSPGTAGCIGFNSIADLKSFIAWLRADNPRLLEVNWGL